MKKIMIIVVAVFVLFASCSGEKKAGYKDGIYFAQADGFATSGWKYMVTLEVKGGKFESVSWNGSHIAGGPDKISLSKDGKYPMVKAGGAYADWHVQSAIVEEYFLSTQDTKMPDAISGATIHIDDFYTLVDKALKSGPAGYGKYKDGVYHAEQTEYSKGYRYFVDVTVISGYAVTANWDAVAEAEGGKNKAQSSRDGEYGMVEKGGAMAPWWQQSQAVSSHFINTQNLKKPDAITGASIGLDEFYTLINEALSNAKR